VSGRATGRGKIKAGEKGGIRSVERAIEILLSFSSRSSMDVTELEERIGLPRPTLYRMLRTLEAKGLLGSSGEPRRYQLGFRVFELANNWASRLDITRLAGPLLEELREASEETVALVVPSSSQMRVCVLEMPSRHALAISQGLGSVEPLHLGAGGKTILAFQDLTSVSLALAKLPPEVSVPRLRSELDGIREAHFSITRGELIPGAVALGVPVFDRDRKVVAAIVLSGPETRLKGPYETRCLRLLRRASLKLSTFLGYSAEDGAHALRPDKKRQISSVVEEQ
jgi:DNA-binding IclR family transcriptional regulator